MSQSPPEFGITPIRGYRRWWMPAPGVLESLYGFGGWSPGITEASSPNGCKVVPCVPAGPPPRPGESFACAGCGLYAYSHPASVLAPAHLVWGVVEGLGRVAKHSRGWRASHARILALCVPEGAREASSVEMARMTASRYGVPVLSRRTLLERFPPEVPRHQPERKHRER